MNAGSPGGSFMKKSTPKKLSLARETVANLETRELDGIAGGSGIISSDNKACSFTRIPETSCWC
jgi:hypothetical protein